jgi:hypothetical protein
MGERTFTKQAPKKAAADDRPEIPKPKSEVSVLHWVGEPERLCKNCEHYRRGKTVADRGECRNLISGTMKVSENDTCARGFYPACDRWPLERRIHS